MQDYIKKYSWALGVIVVIVCAVLAAKAANHVIEGKYLADSAKPKKLDRSRVAMTSKAPRKARDKSGEPLATRNMFCSDCEPPEPEQPLAAADPTDPSVVPLTSLPLKLVATNVSNNPRYSFATIQNTQSESQGAYWVKSEIPGAGEVVAIAGKYVDFRNTTTQRLERVSLLGDAPAVPRSTPAPMVASTTVAKDDTTAMLDEGVKKIDDTTFEIQRSVVDKVLANPMSVARGARIVPSVKNGEANGFKLYAIRPSSMYAKLGLRNGDTVQAVNGFDLTTADKALEVYTKLRDASNLTVTVTRRGKPVTINYTIR